MTVANRDTPTENRIELALMLRDLAYIRDKIDGICQNEDHQDGRLDRVEKITWAISGVTALVALVFVPVAGAAIRMWLGLP